MLFERMTKEENDLLMFLRTEYGGEASQSDFFDGHFVDNQTFLRFWEEAKAPMASAFGDRLIVKKMINVMLEDDELYHKMDVLFHTEQFRRVRKAVFDIVQQYDAEDRWTQWCISYTNPENGRTDCFSLQEILSCYLFSASDWVSNKYNGPSCDIKIQNDIVKVAHGCKLMKILGRFVNYCPNHIKSDFEELRLRQSQILNDAHINTSLCISIHPLDYLTASYNNNNWRSCMCWEDGEFRRGVIEMMNSPMIVVAYLESGSTTMDWLPIHWNSKKWREFFIVRPDMITGIKGYPYWNRTLEKEVIEWLRVMFEPIFNTHYCDSIHKFEASKPIVDPSENIDISIYMDCGPAMYNDFYEGNTYQGIFVPGLHGEKPYTNRAGKTCLKTKIFYSGASQCVCCGNASDDGEEFNGEGEVICRDCVSPCYCCACGETIYSSSNLFEFNGRTYCQFCYEALPHCSCCGERFDPERDGEDGSCTFFYLSVDHSDDRTHILRDITEDYNGNIHGTWMKKFKVCNDCISKIFADEHVLEYGNEHAIRHSFTGYRPVIPIDMLTPFGRDMLVPHWLLDYMNRHMNDENPRCW